MADQAEAAACPQCGSKADVRTVRELFDIMNAGGAQAFQRFNEQSGGPNADVAENAGHGVRDTLVRRWRGPVHAFPGGRSPAAGGGALSRVARRPGPRARSQRSAGFSIA